MLDVKYNNCVTSQGNIYIVLEFLTFSVCVCEIWRIFILGNLNLKPLIKDELCFELNNYAAPYNFKMNSCNPDCRNQTTLSKYVLSCVSD
jgi:hypothetical protein